MLKLLLIPELTVKCILFMIHSRASMCLGDLEIQWLNGMWSSFKKLTEAELRQLFNRQHEYL